MIVSKHLDELRAAAEAEFAASREKATVVEPVVEVPEQPATPETTEPVTTATTAENAEVPAVAEVPAEPVEKPTRRTVYKKTIDLGDGSPVQHFKAATKDELIELLFNAQVNATKRINGLKAENRKLMQTVQPDPAQPAKSYKPRTLSQEEELELVNELQTNPSNALGKALEALFGAPLDDVRADVQYGRQAKQKDSIREIGMQFIAAHPDYETTAKNEKLMAEYIQKNNLAWTLKNLELAFSDLVEAGLVTPLGTEPANQDEEDDDTGLVTSEVTPVVTPVVKPAEQEVPVKPAPTSGEVLHRRRAVVGISSRQAVATAEPATPREASVEDLLKMSPADRRRIVLEQMSRQA